MIDKFHFYFSQFKKARALRQQVQNISYLGKSDGVVVFNTLGAYLADLNAENYLAHLLARDGFKVILLVDDFQLEHWEYILRKDHDDDYKIHKLFKNKTLRTLFGKLSGWVFHHPNIKTVYYSEIFKAVPERLTPTQSDRDHAESSVRKYFQSGEMIWDDPSYQKYFDVCLKNSLMSRKVGIYVDKFLKPDLFVGSHGFYSTWGPAYDYLKNAGYTCVLYYVSVYQPQAAHLLNTTYQFMTDDKFWRKQKDVALSESQLEAVKAYYKNRFGGEALDTQFIFNNIKSYKNLEIETGDAKYVYGLFPNVVWDGDVVQRNIIFKSCIDWIVSTIEYVESHPELHLIIRFHPAEATILSYAKKLEPFIRARVPQVGKIKNVTLISSDAKVDSYKLAQTYVDIGLIFDGMMSLELPYLGIPVIAGARPRNAGSGVIFEPRTKKEYFDLLAQPEKVITDFKNGPYLENLYRFSYWYLFSSCQSVPIFKKKLYGYVDYDSQTESLDPATNPLALKTIEYLKSFTQKKPS